MNNFLLVTRLLVLVLSMTMCLCKRIKEVTYTSWWPPGTEKTEESVGILSSGHLFMTGMMETNMTLESASRQEMYDVRDIAQGANMSLASNVVSCLVNSNPKYNHTLSDIEKSFGNVFPGDVDFTVLAAAGEWSYFNTSISCLAVRKKSKVFSTNFSFASGSIATARGEKVPQVVSRLQSALSMVNEKLMVLDCTAFVQREMLPENIFSDLSQHLSFRGFGKPKWRPTLTVVVLNATQLSPLSLRCSVGIGGPVGQHSSNSPNYAVVDKTSGFLYVDGISGVMGNATDAFLRYNDVLEASGTTMNQTLNCHFYVSDSNDMTKLFQGFYVAFNLNAYPPPSRTEFVGQSLCEDCKVLVKCIALVP